MFTLFVLSDPCTLRLASEYSSCQGYQNNFLLFPLSVMVLCRLAMAAALTAPTIRVAAYANTYFHPSGVDLEIFFWIRFCCC